MAVWSKLCFGGDKRSVNRQRPTALAETGTDYRWRDTGLAPQGWTEHRGCVTPPPVPFYMARTDSVSVGSEEDRRALDEK